MPRFHAKLVAMAKKLHAEYVEEQVMYRVLSLPGGSTSLSSEELEKEKKALTKELWSALREDEETALFEVARQKLLEMKKAQTNKECKKSDQPANIDDDDFDAEEEQQEYGEEYEVFEEEEEEEEEEAEVEEESRMSD